MIGGSCESRFDVPHKPLARTASMSQSAHLLSGGWCFGVHSVVHRTAKCVPLIELRLELLYYAQRSTLCLSSEVQALGRSALSAWLDH